MKLMEKFRLALSGQGGVEMQKAAIMLACEVMAEKKVVDMTDEQVLCMVAVCKSVEAAR